MVHIICHEMEFVEKTDGLFFSRYPHSPSLISEHVTHDYMVTQVSGMCPGHYPSSFIHTLPM